jgi:gas vesicle protein
MKGNSTVNLSGSFNDLFKDLEKDVKKFGEDISVELKKSTQEFQREVDKSGKELEKGFRDLGDSLTTEFKKAGDEINTGLDNAGKSLKNELDNLGRDLENTGKQITDQARTGVNDALGGLDDAGATVKVRAEDVISITNTTIDENVSKGQKSLEQLIAELKSSLVKLEEQLKNGKGAAKEQQKKLENELKGISDSIKVTFDNESRNFKSLTDTGLNNVNNTVNNTKNQIADTGDQLRNSGNSLKDQLKQLRNELKTGFRKAGDDIGSELRKTGDALKGDLNKAGNELGNSFRDAVDEFGRSLSSSLTGKTVYGKDLAVTVTGGETPGATKSTSTKTAATSASDFTMTENAEPPFTFSTRPYPGTDRNNYCGQYAMTTVFKSLGIDKSFEDVYQDTNPAGIFTAPNNITDYLSKNGVENTMKQGASINDLKAQVDTGMPAMILVDAGSAPHWVAVVGYRTTPEGKTEFRVCDSYWGVSKGYATIGEDELRKMWGQPLTGALAFATNYNNLMISVKGKVTPPAKQSILVTPGRTNVEDALGGGICDVVAGWKNRNVGQVAKGVGNSVAGILGAIPNIAGKAISKGSDALQNWGRERSEKGGFFNKLLGGLATGTGKVANVGGSILQTAGNAVTSVAQTAVNGIGKVASSIGSFFSGLFK